jgi:predicted transposase YdaD
MSKPYDAALKAMLEVAPADWPRLAGFPVEQAEVIDADVSTVTAATDKVIRLHGPAEGIMHFDFQAGPDATLPRRVHGYNALLEDRHELPVHSVVVLLRPEAQLRSITGVYERFFPGEREPYLVFRYQLIRVWELPAEQLLAGGLGTLSLAPLGAVTQAELPGMIERMKVKLAAPRYRQVAGRLWTATKVLLGLRYERAFIEQLLRGVHGMKESVTYQAIVEEGVQKGLAQGLEKGLEKGRLEQTRHLLLLLGKQHFGRPASAKVRAQLETVPSLEILENLSGRLLQVRSWDELLAEIPTSPPRRNRKKS